MRYKCNPMLSLVALVLMVLILVFTCTGCTVESEAAKETEPAPRFTVEYVGNGIRLITDSQTGAQYLAYSEYHTGIGMCKLEG